MTAPREFVGDFGSVGLWLWNGGTWTMLSAFDADVLAKANVDGLGGGEIIAGFSAAAPGSGIAASGAS